MVLGRRIILCICVFSLFFILSGCKGRESQSDSNEMVLRHALFSKIKSFDPLSMRDVYSAQISGNIFETLYQYHYLKRPYELIPFLAEGMPEVSADKQTYTIKIKSGVLFHDDKCFDGGKGREMVAEDFIYGLKRIANIKNVSENWSLFADKIIGLDEFREYTKDPNLKDVDYSREVEGLQAPDNYTLVIKLTQPWPQLVGIALADRVTSPIAKEAVDYYGKSITDHPVGTGPFKLKAWKRGSYIELVRNETFRTEAYPSQGGPGDAEAGYLDDAGKKIPFADRVIWTIIEEYQPAWLLFLQGKLDGSPIPKDNYQEALTESRDLTPKMKNLHIGLKSFKDPSTFWLGFNMEDAVVGKNKPLRRALSYAVNREKFIELFFNGRHDIAHGFIPPLMASYNSSLKEKGYSAYDPNRARELLKEAEKVHGGKLPVLKIAIPGVDSFSRQMGQFLRSLFDDVGLELEIEYMDWPTYQEKTNTRSAQIFFSGVSASIPDAEDFLGLFYSRNWAPGSNKFNYKNEEFDRLYDKISVMDESPHRSEIYRQMELIVLEDCPAVFINHRVAYVLLHEWYKNYKPHVFQYGVAKYRRIDMENRRAYKDLLKKVK